jgi:hypothetical protein
MSKPIVITLPIVMILLDYWPLDRLQSRKIVTNIPEIISVSTNKGKKKNKFKKEALKKNISPPRVQKLSEPRIAGIIPLWQLKEKLPFLILSVVLAIITLYNPETRDVPDTSYSKPIPFIYRLANAPVAFVTYLEKTFWPHDMAVFYPFSDQLPLWQVLGASFLIILISAAVIIMAKRCPYLFAGWLWFSITIAPVIEIIQISKSAPYAMADRYHYLPSIGLAVMIAWGIPALIKSEEIRKKLLFPTGIIFMGIISFLSWNQCGYWKDHLVLFNHTLQVTKDNALAHNSIGLFLFNEGKIEEAIDHYNKAIRITPNYAEAHNNRGIIYNKLGQYQRAIEDYNEAIRLKPHFAMSYYNRGNVYRELSQYQQAIEDYNEAIRLQPDYVDAYKNRGGVYFNQGNEKLGCRDAQKACELGNCQALLWAKGRSLCR